MKPKTHNYTDRFFGHDYVITEVCDNGQKLNMMGWGHGISAGDYILLVRDEKNGTRADTRYKVETITYMADPKDMWTMVAAFAPRPPVEFNKQDYEGKKANIKGT